MTDTKRRPITWDELTTQYHAATSFEEALGLVHAARSAVVPRANAAPDASITDLERARLHCATLFLTTVGRDLEPSEPDPRIRAAARTVLARHIISVSRNSTPDELTVSWISFFGNEDARCHELPQDALANVHRLIEHTWALVHDQEGFYRASGFSALLVPAFVRTRHFAGLTRVNCFAAITVLYTYLSAWVAEASWGASWGTERDIPAFAWTGWWSEALGHRSDDLQKLKALLTRPHQRLFLEDCARMQRCCAKALQIRSPRNGETVSAEEFHDAARTLLELLAGFTAWLGSEIEDVAEAERVIAGLRSDDRPR